MSNANDYFVGRRLSLEGNLCTVRYIGPLIGTSGVWLGVEWDDPTRGKHNGSYKENQIFECLSTSATAATFIRPTRKFDPERTVLEAIKYKYGGDVPNGQIKNEVVVISGKVAEEVGFDKIAREQARLAELRIVLIDKMVVHDVAHRNSSPESLVAAREELALTCPNITELDLGWNVFETWSQVVDVCIAFPKLKVLKASGLRLLSPFGFPASLHMLKELHLDDCLLKPANICQILEHSVSMPLIEELSLSGNLLTTLVPPTSTALPRVETIKTLHLDNNSFTNLEFFHQIVTMFPSATSISLQNNQINGIGSVLDETRHQFPQIKTLNISGNLIASWAFIDRLSEVFPNLSSLRTTNNPLFGTDNNTTALDPRASDKLFFLTLARIPRLQTLNYAKITPRDREEGEIYYLSVAEKELKDMLAVAEAKGKITELIGKSHPRYLPLTAKYDRESIIDLLASSKENISDQQNSLFGKPKYPVGSVGARLIRITFYLAADAQSKIKRTEVKLTIPSSLAASQVMGLLLRQPDLASAIRPFQFQLIFESPELDPVDTTAESTTKSITYGKRLTTEQKRTLWREWGEWDAEAMVQQAYADELAVNDECATKISGERWTEDGTVCIKEGRKWKRREVIIPPALKRPIGDFLDDAADVTIRIVPLPFVSK